MALDQDGFNKIKALLSSTLNFTKQNNYNDFLEMVHINDQLLLEIQKLAFKPSHFIKDKTSIYPVVNVFNTHISRIKNEASIEQQKELLCLIILIFQAFDQKVETFRQDPLIDIKHVFFMHLVALNNEVQALPRQAPMSDMLEICENSNKMTRLIDIIDILKSNILDQKNERQTIRNSSWKVNLLNDIQDKLRDPNQASTDINQHIEDISNVCAMKRNVLHFWSIPHSVSEFEQLLASDKLFEKTDDNLSHSKAGIV